MTPEPKEEPRVYVLETALPSESITEKCVVSGLSSIKGIFPGKMSSEGVFTLELIDLARSFA